LPSTASAIAAATSPTKAGWKRVSPPPIKGSAGDIRASAAKRLKKSSSGPNRIEGRMITVELCRQHELLGVGLRPCVGAG
jgi:hypothetical protein